MATIPIFDFDLISDLFYYFKRGTIDRKPVYIQQWFLLKELDDSYEITWVLEPANYLEGHESTTKVEMFSKENPPEFISQALMKMRLS